MQGIVLKRFRTEQQFPVQPADIQTINRLLVREYLKESGRIWEVDFQVALTIYRYRKAMHNNDIIIYTTEDGLSEFTLRELDGELWLAQKEIAELYQTSKQNIGKHIKAIFAEQELDDSVVNFQFTTAADGKNYRWNVFSDYLWRVL